MVTFAAIFGAALVGTVLYYLHVDYHAAVTDVRARKREPRL